MRHSVIFIFIASLSLGAFLPLRAAPIEDLKQKIEDKAKSILELEAAIAEYTKEVRAANAEAKSLSGAVQVLDSTRKKLAADIKLTEAKIASAELKIEEIEGSMSDVEKEMLRNQAGIMTTLKTIDVSDELSMVEAVFGYDSLSDFWGDRESLYTVQASLSKSLAELKQNKEHLASLREKSLGQKKDLSLLATEIGDRKKIVEQNKNEKNSLLTQTKNKESAYKKILDEKIALREAFRKELLQFESDLQIAIDPSKLPSAGKGVLSWPLETVRITQYFGKTEFATAHAALYSGNGHNGIDLGAPVGTKIFSAADGVVEGVGDTDLVCPSASYGKWVLVRHGNGLSTLYAHLSVISVKAGDSVARGQTVGYSGNTGYSTGPHLHFTVYASEGVKILSRKSLVCGGTYIMPIADLKAYLNPLSYI
ncbi:MAG: hypothetical protein A2928_01805 [Candidatus Taylorbacteria bacterium RIFCSPLOWO2_01_FULL_45_15b]|uniref:M23ase beta-sheet core domain-containing protein n=1 Tax=Candidatus Taylorbacteria bacterium RIFCSPLOWO2_01_FULL_45_15b TaxID=1802319 RepID=A0A1G2NC54_9BACT|nr:MAG: hypothetical protein A2928_01805 [Candidatus Taylorbacteria bacterium RIFCSPLOWO2_01_FULL_45_15b]